MLARRRMRKLRTRRGSVCGAPCAEAVWCELCVCEAGTKALPHLRGESAMTRSSSAFMRLTRDLREGRTGGTVTPTRRW